MDGTTILLTVLDSANWGTTTDGIAAVVGIVGGAITAIISLIIEGIERLKRNKGNNVRRTSGKRLKPKQEKRKE